MNPFEHYQHYEKNRKGAVPDSNESLEYIRHLPKSNVADCLAKAKAAHRLLVQPRCGTAQQQEMHHLLHRLEAEGKADILSVTIDSHTRLLQFDAVEEALIHHPHQINGYPLVTHGWQKGRLLNEAVKVPIEVRHGSPDGRLLFGASIAAGFTSFEGGGIGYNIPYCKNVPLADSLRYWQEIDQYSGDLAKEGIIVDREFFGILTAVLVPPSIGITTALLEAILAAASGVKCLSLAYGQTGNLVQDIAALRAMQSLARKYLPSDSAIYPIFHQFMGAFPSNMDDANALITYGAITAKLGGATKIINKTCHEALGIPSVEANIAGICLTRAGTSWIMDLLPLQIGEVEEEQNWIEREVRELIDPLLGEADLIKGIDQAFAKGTLDVPFSASIYARSEILPVRDNRGAIRFKSTGNLPFSSSVKRRNAKLLDDTKMLSGGIFGKIKSDIYYFCKNQANAA